MLNYKGYAGHVEFDDEAGVFHGELVGTRDVVTFQGESVAELGQAFRESVDDYLAFRGTDQTPDVRPDSSRVRDVVMADVQLLASASEQLHYEREVPVAFVPGELLELGRAIFRPKSASYIKAFTDDELGDLAHLYGLIVEATRFQASSVTELHKRPEWRRVMSVAKDVAARLTRAS